MRYLLLLLALVALCSAKTDCEKVYVKCKHSTTGTNRESLSGWLSEGYNKISGRNLCLDFFEGCKKLRY